MSESVEKTLKERGERYGEFKYHAEISQDLKKAMYMSGGWAKLSKPQQEALEMIQHKIARILNGDPDYSDNWHDIAGYAKLAEDLL